MLRKRYLYNRRNWKSLLTQIILPACFICIAMTVALGAPGFDDLPALELSTAQFYHLPKILPAGTHMPYSHLPPPLATNTTSSKSASTRQIVETLTFLAGLGGTCALNQPNLTINDLINFNFSINTGASLFNGRYFGATDSCRVVLNQDADVDFDYFNVTGVRKRKERSSYSTSFFGGSNGGFNKKYYPKCDCMRDYSGFECTDNYDMPSSFNTLSHEVLLNITGENETDYYLYTTDLYRLNRYGGLSFDNERRGGDSSSSSSAPQFDEMQTNELVQNLIKHRIGRIWYNNKAFHGIPIYVNVMNNALLRANVRNTLDRVMSADEALLRVNEYGITVINHPMNQTNNYLSTEYLLQGSDVLISIFTIVAMSFVNASFVLFLVYERSIKSLHLQFLMGLNPLLYWTTNIIWDLLNYLLPASCVIIIFKVRFSFDLVL
jgi:ATP-binding cassette subfamily A (ABC1) protein 2